MRSEIEAWLRAAHGLTPPDNLRDLYCKCLRVFNLIIAVSGDGEHSQIYDDKKFATKMSIGRTYGYKLLYINSHFSSDVILKSLKYPIGSKGLYTHLKNQKYFFYKNSLRFSLFCVNYSIILPQTLVLNNT
jgi:hypothetical protein